MKLINVNELTGNEILAKPVITDDYQVLLSEETSITKEIIDRLKRLEITEVYVKEELLAKKEELVLLKSEIEESVREKVKDIIENHSYSDDEEFAQIAETADRIIGNILDEDQVADKIFEIKNRDADIYMHSINLCSIATIVAIKLNLPESRIHDIGVGCLLHDIGLKMLKFNYENEDINDLPKGRDVEYMKHPVYGYSMLKDEQWLSNLAKTIILYHHERMDGSGYPLHAKEVSFEVGVVSVCDVFDEMICGIGHKKVKVYEAVEYLKSLSNIQFYPQIVNTLLKIIAIYPIGCEVKLTDGSIGKVVKQNPEFPDRPVVNLTKDKNGNIIPHGQTIDLIKVNNIFIEKELTKA